MSETKLVLRGTLELLILKSLALKPFMVWE
jgi:hypothetical protein